MRVRFTKLYTFEREGKTKRFKSGMVLSDDGQISKGAIKAGCAYDTSKEPRKEAKAIKKEDLEDLNKNE